MYVCVYVCVCVCVCVGGGVIRKEWQLFSLCSNSSLLSFGLFFDSLVSISEQLFFVNR